MGPGGPPEWVRRGKPPTNRLASALHQLSVARDLGTLGEAARQQAVPLVGERVLVSVKPRRGEGAAARAATMAAGGQVVSSGDDYLFAQIPVPALPGLAHHPSVAWVAPPPQAKPSDHNNLHLIGTTAWHSGAPALKGSGVKIGIIDYGFQGYLTHVPSAVPTTCGLAVSDTDDSDHGTKVADVVRQTAPEAELFLARVDAELSRFRDAVNCLTSLGVRVINHSGEFNYAPLEGPGDGTGYSNETINQAVAAGAFWSQSAGNAAKYHWNGQWSDSNGNGALDFPTGDDFMLVKNVSQGATVSVALRWDDPWAGACRDYDLHLYSQRQLNPQSLKAKAESTQSCLPGSEPGVPPVENLRWTADSNGPFYLAIVRANPANPSDPSPKFDLLSFTNSHELELPTAANSLPHPADSGSSGMATVGAVSLSTPTTLEDYSSRGPTTDGRIKPDLVAPTNVGAAGSTLSGTSGSAPHVAGAAALVKQRNPGYGPADIKSYLQGWAVDLGAAGADNESGHGRLNLPPPRSVGTDAGVSCIPVSNYDGSWCARQRDGSAETIETSNGALRVNDWSLGRGQYFRLSQIVIGDTPIDQYGNCAPSGCTMTVTIYGKNLTDDSATRLTLPVTRSSSSPQRWTFDFDPATFRWQTLRVEFDPGGSWRLPGEVVLVGSIEDIGLPSPSVSADPRVRCNAITNFDPSWCGLQRDGAMQRIGTTGAGVRANDWALTGNQYFRLSQVVIGDTATDLNGNCAPSGCSMTLRVYGKNPADTAPTLLATQTRNSVYPQRWTLTLDPAQRWQVVRVEFDPGGSWQAPGEVLLIGSIEDTSP